MRGNIREWSRRSEKSLRSVVYGIKTFEFTTCLLKKIFYIRSRSWPQHVRCAKIILTRQRNNGRSEWNMGRDGTWQVSIYFIILFPSVVDSFPQRRCSENDLKPTVVPLKILQRVDQFLFAHEFALPTNFRVSASITNEKRTNVTYLMRCIENNVLGNICLGQIRFPRPNLMRVGNLKPR